MPDFSGLYFRNNPNRAFVFHKFRQTPNTHKILRLSKLNYQSYKKKTALRVLIFKTSTADLISTDPQLLQCTATGNYCTYKQKQILQVKKIRVYWYHMRIYNKMSSVEKPKRYKLRKYEVVY